MRAIRDYKFEWCWLLLVVVIAGAPRRMSALALDWDDQTVFCEECCPECDGGCYCLPIVGGQR